MGCKWFICLDNVPKPSSNNFEWIKETSQFIEDFIKDYNKRSDEGYFLKVDVQHLKELSEDFYESVQKLVAHLHDKTEYVIYREKFKIVIKSWISF